MTRKLLIIIGTTLSAFFIVYIYQTIFYLKLPEIVNCTIVSDKGTLIPAKLYSRTVGNNHKHVEEFILSFNDALVDDQLNIPKNEKLVKYLLIVPKQEMIGLMDDLNSLKEKNGYILQTNDDANQFTSMVNNFTFFENPPIKEASFKKNQITFNTYGVLKMFGNNIIINIGDTISNQD